MKDVDLFDQQATSYRPLADRIRPETLDEVVGQKHVLGQDKPLRSAIENGHLHSMVFWGPPGCGKTTLAHLIALHSDSEMIKISAVLGGVSDIRKAVTQARSRRAQGLKTLLFVDEVHRFNKAQQDAFLPHVEDGTFIFIGATTENPSFELNNALLSRSRVYVLKPVQADDIMSTLKRAIQDSRSGLGSRSLKIEDAALKLLAEWADGDVRRALNTLETVADLVETTITSTDVKALLGDQVRRFDKGGEAFYDQISALHKSVRNSHPDAALYWCVRMLDGGCDPLYIARRLIRMASEDIGNADPRALQIALTTWDVIERLGRPEGDLTLAQTVIFLACAPKSNAVYTAFKATQKLVKETGSLEVPMSMRNAPTKLMKALDYGKSYLYDHDYEHAFAAEQTCLPEEIADIQFYHPVDRGLEKRTAESLAYIRYLRESKNKPNE